jgi:hypothetical protein
LVKGGRQKGPHIFALNKRNRQMGFQVDGDRQKGSRISLFEGRQMGPHISCLLKGIARWDYKLIKGDRQKGSRVSLFGGRQMGPRFSYLFKKKRNRQMGFQVD